MHNLFESMLSAIQHSTANIMDVLRVRTIRHSLWQQFNQNKGISKQANNTETTLLVQNL